jgi:hypothetical protein
MMPSRQFQFAPLIGQGACCAIPRVHLLGFGNFWVTAEIKAKTLPRSKSDPER